MTDTSNDLCKGSAKQNAIFLMCSNYLFVIESNLQQLLHKCNLIESRDGLILESLVNSYVQGRGVDYDVCASDILQNMREMNAAKRRSLQRYLQRVQRMRKRELLRWQCNPVLSTLYVPMLCIN